MIVPQIISIVYKPATLEKRPENNYSRASIPTAELLVGKGIAGDKKGLPDRQLNVMLAETVAQLEAEGFKTGPGELGEQIVIAGLNAEEVVSGVRLRMGPSAVIELIKPRVACSRFEHIQGQPMKIVRGRIGFIARVVCDGKIEVGSTVAIEPHEPQT